MLVSAPHILWRGSQNESVLQRKSCKSAQGLAAVQPKMQAWLGRLGSWADALALGPVAAEREQDISKRWDAKDMIGLKVSFPGMENSAAVLRLDSLPPLVSLYVSILSSARPLLFLLSTVHGSHNVSCGH